MATLWIGGSSGLAKTYIYQNGYHQNGDSCPLILAGLEANAPEWIEHEQIRNEWMQIDMRSAFSASSILDKTPRKIETIILGIRAPLVHGGGVSFSSSNNHHEELLVGVEALIKTAIAKGVKHILHISSVAAADHLRVQRQVTENDPLPPLESYKAGYDIFKRKSEDIISNICHNNNMMNYCHLRVSAIFSDDVGCIQCNALLLQSRLGSYLTTPIDCNSGRNISAAVRLVLKRWKESPERNIQSIYYYTRPTLHPVPYGDHLVDYRAAYNIHYAIWIPVWIVEAFVGLVHVLVSHTWLRYVPFMVSIDYLLQVSSREHSFSNKRFRDDFPDIVNHEETIYDAFIRRRKILQL
mmetsp:Transcript_9391/g.13350  ORF Transcript_9391/g.13350 Transcript_9391/m.13350 type:complete len:353 (+) Transcript_9391:129-1187(+)